MSTDSLVLVTARSFGRGREDPESVLRRAGLTVVHGDTGHDLDILAADLPRAVAWIAGTAPIREEHLRAAPRLRLIARYGVGVDAVDLEAAARHGVVVTNTPGANADAVADLTIGLILALLRGLADADRAVRAGEPFARVGRELGGCTVGIVGYGQVGRAVRRRLQGFGSTVVAHDPFVTQADIPLVSLEALAGISDVVTLHATATGQPVVDRAFLRAMREGALLVNTARASLVDDAAAADALQSGRLAGLGSDVSDDAGGDVGPLFAASNVILTPHIGAHTLEAVDRVGMAAAAECIRVLVDDQPPRHPVKPAIAS